MKGRVKQSLTASGLSVTAEAAGEAATTAADTRQSLASNSTSISCTSCEWRCKRRECISTRIPGINRGICIILRDTGTRSAVIKPALVPQQPLTQQQLAQLVSAIVHQVLRQHGLHQRLHPHTITNTLPMDQRRLAQPTDRD